VDFSGDGDSAVDGDDAGSEVIKVIDGDGVTPDDDEPEPDPVPEAPEVPEPAPVPPADDEDGSAGVVGATAELVYVPLAE
jgi:hypothetical protein